MEHALHLAAKHFVEEVAPTPASGVNWFIQLADDSDEVLKLKGKLYAYFRLSAQEWTELDLMREVLQEPADAQQSFSPTHEPTVWRTIPVLEYLQETLQNMADSTKFSHFSTAIEAGVSNLSKWYGKTDDMDMYFICLALDPNYKVAYAKDKWAHCFFETGM
ncbi:hypothetical protein C8R48DRAFT_676025 [Suillus tomentosus]|nr:hypothetical protein C8R48DRAFT_676025 [Suillus tomentosus]